MFRYDIRSVRKAAFMAEILVTGGAGFIGSHLIERLIHDGVSVTLVDDFNDFEGYWHPAGGIGWKNYVKEDTSLDIIGVELQSEFPSKTATRWGRVLGESPHSVKGNLELHLNNSILRFVQLRNERGAGLRALDLLVVDTREILKRASEKGCFIKGDAFQFGGVLWRLHTRRFF